MTQLFITARHALLTFATAAFAATGCAATDQVGEADAPTVDALQTALDEGCAPLYAGRDAVGSVCVNVDGDQLTVHYRTHGGCTLDSLEVWMGEDLADLPAGANGAPQLDRFPHRSDPLPPGTDEATLTIPLEQLGGQACELAQLVAAHAKVSRDGASECAWGGARELTQGREGRCFEVDLACGGDDPSGAGCEPGEVCDAGDGGGLPGHDDAPDGPHAGEPTDCDGPAPLEPVAPAGEPICETAYAFGGQTFVELGLTSDRWGWQIGPVEAGSSFSTPIYAGAGQNDVTAGEQVGTLFVSYDGATATIDYAMSPGFTLDETHLYVGAAPVDTTSPGQLGNAHDLEAANADRFVVGGFDGQPLYVVAHGVSCTIAP